MPRAKPLLIFGKSLTIIEPMARPLRTEVALLFSLLFGPFAGGQISDPAEKQVVLETTCGALIMEVFPGVAPNHVSKFLERIRAGFYVGTIFHRAIPRAIVQGGDPLTRDPANRNRYGTGGLMELEQEFNELSHLLGTVSSVLVPGNPDSAGSQFFICVSDQLQLDGNYTSFGRVVEGFQVLETISNLPSDDQEKLIERVQITATYERDRPPPPRVPFADTPEDELANYTVVLRTELGEIEIGLFPEDAPQHVRQFLRFSELGLYTGTRFHRVIPGFVIQGGLIATRKEPVLREHSRYVKPLQPESNKKKHVCGIVSMARRKDPGSAVDSFFIVLASTPGLDENYTIFGQVVEGIDAVDGISQIPTHGEVPILPIYIQDVRLKVRE